ncbi:MAG: hypothetical protein ACK5GZ_00735 [Cyanobium sp.]|jgi:hypothetical protein
MSPTFTKGLLKGAALAVAGAAALGAGSATASTISCTFGTLSACNGTTGLFTIGGLNTLGNATTPANASIIFDGTSEPGKLSVTFQSNGNQNNPALRLPSSGSLKFTATPSAGNFFSGWEFVGITGAGGSAGTFGLTADGTVLESSNDFFTALDGTFALLPPAGVTWGMDWNFTAQRPLSYSGTFTTDVPLPLPIVGAGLAFGFTRKLRQRAKSLA